MSGPSGRTPTRVRVAVSGSGRDVPRRSARRRGGSGEPVAVRADGRAYDSTEVFGRFKAWLDDLGGEGPPS